MAESAERPTTDVPQIVATLTGLPEVLAALLSSVEDAALRTRPAEGEWCPLEVVGHLIACDSEAFRDRIRAIVDGTGPFPPFDPWEAINARHFANMALQEIRRLPHLTPTMRRALMPEATD